MSETILKDKSGREIRPGHFIVYGHALGRCAGLRFGIVKDVYEADHRWRDEKKVHLRIRGVDMEGGHWDPKTKKWVTETSLLSKDSTLQFGDRVIVLLDAQLPEDVRKLLSEEREKLLGTQEA